MNGLHLYDLIHSSSALRDIPAIITTAGLENHVQEFSDRGLTALAKPFDIDDLLATIEHVMH